MCIWSIAQDTEDCGEVVLIYVVHQDEQSMELITGAHSHLSNEVKNVWLDQNILPYVPECQHYCMIIYNKVCCKDLEKQYMLKELFKF